MKGKHLYGAVMLALFLGYAPGVQAATTYGADTTVDTLTTTATTTTNQYVYGVNNNATLTVSGDSVLDLTASSDESWGIDVTNGNLTAPGTLDISIAPASGTTGSRPKGMIVRAGSTADIGTLNINTVLASASSVADMSPDSNAAYGLAVGYNYSGGSATQESNVTVNAMNLDVTNTADSIVGVYSVTRRIGFFTVTANIDVGYQLSGLKIYRTTGAVPTFTANGPVNINVYDSSTAKSGDYLTGIYISGDEAQAIFNGDTNITVAANGINSAGIKIGKPFDGELNTGATVTVNGKLNLDTTATADSAAVRLFGSKSQFYVTGENTSEASTIASGNSAIVFDTQDYKTSGAAFVFSGNPSRNENNLDNIVSLKNTVLSTTSDDASLIKARAEDVSDTLVDVGGSYVNMSGKFNTGTFYTWNSQFTLTGELSEATAAASGWLIEVEGNDTTLSSSMIANVEDGATVTGLIHKEGISNLKFNVDNATWNLRDTIVTDGTTSVTNTSTANAITLTNGALLNVVYDHATSLADQTIVLTNVTNSANIGTLTNDSSTITMDNGLYGDVLKIDGNYAAAGDAILKVNTIWNSPGDTNYGNSTSDLLHITGTADGVTTVKSISADGSEDLLDGTIGSIAADLDTRSAVVVQVDGTDDGSHFVGTARTTGAGQLQLASDVKDGSQVYYWTVTTVNPGGPIYDPVVPGYVQMPKANAEMLRDTVRTYHERRGENRILGWDRPYLYEDDTDQFWARYISNRIEVRGKHRLGYDLKTKGIQLGNDFKIDYDDEGGYDKVGAYFSFMKGDMSFYDKYRAVSGIIQSDKYMGSGDANVYSLGLTKTRYDENGKYLDIVGQLSYIENEYLSRDSVSAKNHGWGFTASVETGKPHIMRETKSSNWLIEPQAQLLYTHVSLNDMNDGTKFVQQNRMNELIGRLGVRFSYNRTPHEDAKHTRTVYGVLNIWQTLGGRAAAMIGSDLVSERYGRTVGEIGLGFNVPMNHDLYLYGDARYEFDLGGGDYEGHRATVGMKYTW